MTDPIAPRSEEVCEAIESRKGVEYTKAVSALVCLRAILRAPFMPAVIGMIANDMIDTLIDYTPIDRADLEAFDRAAKADANDLAKRIG